MQNHSQNRNTIGTRIGVAALAFALSAGLAQAGTSGTFTYTASQADILTDWSRQFVLPQFNPSFGTLESIQISVSYDIKVSGTVASDAATASTLWLQAGADFRLSLPNQTSALGMSLATENTRFILNPQATAQFGTFKLTQTASLTLTGSQMNDFIGTGSVSFAGRTIGWESQSIQLGNPTISLTTLAGANVTVTYFDTLAVVPEPSLGALTLVGLGCLAAGRHTSRKHMISKRP
jgi:hypothetical protein